MMDIFARIYAHYKAVITTRYSRIRYSLAVSKNVFLRERQTLYGTADFALRDINCEMLSVRSSKLYGL